MARYGAACEDCSWTYECSDVSVAREAVARHAKLHEHESFYVDPQTPSSSPTNTQEG